MFKNAVFQKNSHCVGSDINIMQLQPLLVMYCIWYCLVSKRLILVRAWFINRQCRGFAAPFGAAVCPSPEQACPKAQHGPAMASSTTIIGRQHGTARQRRSHMFMFLVSTRTDAMFTRVIMCYVIARYLWKLLEYEELVVTLLLISPFYSVTCWVFEPFSFCFNNPSSIEHLYVLFCHPVSTHHEYTWYQ
jgi:hypothetical protein